MIFYGKWFEPRSLSRLCGLIVRVRVVPRRTVVGDIDRRFDNLSGSHHQSHVNCVSPVHNCPLRVGKWTDVLDGARADPRNPRLVYDLHGNLVLVQVLYECSDRLPGHKNNGHRYLSASNEVLRLLPYSVANMFPVIMQQRCAFTTRLYDYIITGIYQGQNFMDLSEGIASMNFREFLRNNPDNNDLVKGFQTSMFCSYPGKD